MYILYILCIYIHVYIYICISIIYIYIYTFIYSGEKTTLLSKKYFDMMSSTVLLQLKFYIQKFIF